MKLLEKAQTMVSGLPGFKVKDPSSAVSASIAAAALVGISTVESSKALVIYLIPPEVVPLSLLPGKGTSESAGSKATDPSTGSLPSVLKLITNKSSVAAMYALIMTACSPFTKRPTVVAS